MIHYTRKQVITRFAETFASTAGLISQNAGRSVAEISLVSGNEVARILKISAGEKLDYDRNLTFVDIFRKQVQKYPGHKAITDKTSYLNYKELDEWSDKLARKLLSLDVVPDSFRSHNAPPLQGVHGKRYCSHESEGSLCPARQRISE